MRIIKLYSQAEMIEASVSHVTGNHSHVSPLKQHYHHGIAKSDRKTLTFLISYY